MKKGEQMPEDVRRKISLSKKGHLVSSETRQKISQKLTGVAIGRKDSIEVCLKKSAAAKLRLINHPHTRPNKPFVIGHVMPLEWKVTRPGWKGGITPLRLTIRHHTRYSAWRIAVFQRDNYTCVLCGSKRGGNLNADHIKPFAFLMDSLKIKTLKQALACTELWEISNGRTLCVPCHKETFNYLWKSSPSGRSVTYSA